MAEKSWRWALRERTQEVHGELDKLIGKFDTVRSYKRYLLGAAAFRSSVEPLISKIKLSADTSYRPTLIDADLRSDLLDLDLEFPTLVRLDTVCSMDGMLGVLYVVEGSSLGAKVLIKRAIALGLSNEHGARHLFRQAQAAENWRRYLALLDDACQLDLEACSAAAVATFNAALVAFRER